MTAVGWKKLQVETAAMQDVVARRRLVWSQLLADLEPVSAQVLTQTLRAMDPGGLAGGALHPDVQQRVEHALLVVRGGRVVHDRRGEPPLSCG